jgi:hypothetical protein
MVSGFSTKVSLFMKCVCWCNKKQPLKYGLFILETMGDALTQQVEALKQEKSLRQMVFLSFSEFHIGLTACKVGNSNSWELLLYLFDKSVLQKVHTCPSVLDPDQYTDLAFLFYDKNERETNYCRQKLI